jgi:hypothetical protein
MFYRPKRQRSFQELDESFEELDESFENQKSSESSTSQTAPL